MKTTEAAINKRESIYLLGTDLDFFPDANLRMQGMPMNLAHGTFL
jgi:hypothetical protein